jgi:cation diffusion facilitator family transporter
MMLLGAAVGIAFESVREIRTPHSVPAPWTLAVLVGVVVVKWMLARRVAVVASETGSTAVKADAAHHLSDALTSAAAFIGISLALVGSRYWEGRWESADDWAALVAALVIAFNGVSMLRAATHDLMDRMPGPEVVGPIRETALGVPGVRAIEKLHVRKAGIAYRVTLHVHADGSMSLEDAHALAGRVKHTILEHQPHVNYVLVHMEPYVSYSSDQSVAS